MSQASLEFLWLELTNQCNLQCRHCYSSSGPLAGASDFLTMAHYDEIMRHAHARGCRALQFIGGEPTLNRDLPSLIQTARDLGYDLIEVYSNLVSVSEALWSEFAKNHVHLATSFYSADPDVFDAITTRPGSFVRIRDNIRIALERSIPIRVGVIAFDHTRDALDDTLTFVRALGVDNVGVDHVRAFGRGADDASSDMASLCGNCANGVLAVGPDGVVAPCIMSKAWNVGSLRDQSLDEILAGEALAETRKRIFESTHEKVARAATIGASNCQPYFNCTPNASCNPCAPNGGHKCNPNYNCNPGMIEARHVPSASPL